MEIADEELIEEIRQGDISAFELLVKRYQGKLFYFVLNIVLDSSLAEEVVQDTFLAIYKAVEKIDTKRKFFSYIFTVARNTSVSALRRQHKEISLNDVPEPEGGDDVWETVIREELKSTVKKALLGIKKEYRQILKLYYFEGLSYKEIAKVLSVPLNTVKTRIKRAKEALGRRYGK